MAGSIPLVRAVERALRILDCFDEEHPVLGPAEAARRVGLPKSTAYRLMLTLAAHGYLERVGEERFELGRRLLYLGLQVRAGGELREAAHPVMVALRDRFRESVHLHIREGHERVCIHSVEGTHDLRVAGSVGRRAPLYAGASARAILAFLPPAEVEAVLAAGLSPLTPATITNPDRLRAELERVRRQGYAVSAGERIEGTASIAVPLWRPSGEVVGSLAVSGPRFRFDPEGVPGLVPALFEAAAAIYRRLGGRGRPPGQPPAHPALAAGGGRPQWVSPGGPVGSQAALPEPRSVS